ncbi:MAG: enoyl-CoA hydratase/isomerase family protein [Gammaproteobacteria bacterium]|nr:enoyl-CoA hydratase/isomerase family protein [Gammaproteobacteria bacterium]
MLERHDHGPVREIRLNRPPANALNGDLISQLDQALKSASNEAGAVVLSGLPGMFSAGLDVPELLELDRAQFSGMWQRFIGVQRTIATLPVPIAFALTGHAPAGGILLGVFGDFRVMPSGAYKTGLNEVKLGLVVPEPPYHALVRLIGQRVADELVMTGDMLSSERAVEIGLVDELADSPEATVARAVEWCESRLALPRPAMLMSREMTRRSLHRIFENYDAAGDDVFIDLWFQDSTQATLREMVARLKKR